MKGRLQVIIAILVAGILHCSSAIRCNREPYDSHAPKSVDSRFQVRISGNPEKYVPGGVYTVTLLGQRIGRIRPTFKKFMLVVEPSYSYLSSWENNAFGHRNVGSFALDGGGVAKYSNHCPNAIIETSSLKKSKIDVTWTAPPPGSGCVVFRATVVEDHDVWYMDDGPLSLMLCEDTQEHDSNQPEFIFPCCACDDALYEMVFEGMWSKPTHPKEFPSNEWLTGFSDLIGASHSADYRFWEYGNFASEGMRLVAEYGAPQVLEGEIMAKSEHVRTVIKARGLSYPNVTGKTYSAFRVDTNHHVVSIVSKIDPSPDWIVGVSSFNLCLTNCSWAEYRVLNLYPWDVGTDSGITYTSPDSPSIPRQTVSRITSSYPNDMRSPFYDPSGEEVQPLARLYLRRQQVFVKQCDFTDSEPTGDCSVTEWSEWSHCSVTCGQGLNYRQRSYIDKVKAERMSCSEELIEQGDCYGPQEECSTEESEGSDNPKCALSEWTSWSPCSAEICGIGEQTRTRHYKSKKALRHCSRQSNAQELQQTIGCHNLDDPSCTENLKENHDDACPGYEWSAWSPCSASCGKGKSMRRRVSMTEEQEEEEPAGDSNIAEECPESHMVEEMDCTADFPSCNLTRRMYKELCMMPMVEGDCYGQNSRWHYDQDLETCEEFVYKGCNGNRNNYLTQEDCENTCKREVPEGEDEDVTEEASTNNGPINGMLPSSHIIDLNATYGLVVSTVPTYTFTEVDGTVVDCVVTRWNNWSKCSVTCGRGFKLRHRTIVRHPMNGGKACPKIYKRKKCGRKCDDDEKNANSAESYFGNHARWTIGK